MSEIHGSLCMQCQGEGTTRMLMTKIPFFREVIISSFECDNCGWSNNQVLFGGELQEKGCRFELTVKSSEDLDRQIIKSDYASVAFPGIEFEIPPKTQQGEITTIEGLLSTAAERLGYDQAYRVQTDPDLGAAVANIILKLRALYSGEELPFTVVVDDPSGNSFVENPKAPARDPCLATAYYARTPEQVCKQVYILRQSSAPEGARRGSALAAIEEGGGEEGGGDGAANGAKTEQEEETSSMFIDENFLKREYARFEDFCPNCKRGGETLMCMADIPHFKEVIIMAFNCQECGYKSNEVKGGGEVPLQGTMHKLTAISPKDFARDILKSDSCAIELPELELEMDMGTLGSMYTTIEGLLEKIRNNLCEGNPFYSGDSATHHHGSEGATQVKFRVFLEKLDALRDGQHFPFTLVLRDPLGNSFIGALGYDDPADDP
ncbi:ZPR1 zinc-finger domain-containing protein, partial [Tribonema minus]